MVTDPLSQLALIREPLVLVVGRYFVLMDCMLVLNLSRCGEDITSTNTVGFN